MTQILKIKADHSMTMNYMQYPRKSAWSELSAFYQKYQCL